MTDAIIYFKDFLKNIRLTQNQVKDLARGHKTLRKRLLEDEELSKIVETTFLQGSYKRNTAVRPKNGNRSDVDIIVVTNIDSKDSTPQEAMDMFIPFLDRYYGGKYEMNSRSIGIELSYVDLDLVITAKIENEQTLNFMERESKEIDLRLQEFLDPDINDYTFSEAYNSIFNFSASSQVKDPKPILIPDRDTETWEQTNPIAQINWTIQKNSNCNGHYINVVKAIKWWKKHHPEPKYPKGYPLEHFVGEVCPDDISSVASGVVETFEKIVQDYQTKPILKDHGVPDHDVFKRVTDEEYDQFHELIKVAAKSAREAIDEEDNSRSVSRWRELFGDDFPPPLTPPSENKTQFTKRNSMTGDLGSARFG